MIRRLALSVVFAIPLAFLAAALLGSVVAGWIGAPGANETDGPGQGEVLLRSQVVALTQIESTARCVWEHTGIDGQTTTTRLPFPCDRPVRSTSRRIRTTAYYSPAPDQAAYATGTMEGDLALNGQGVRTADGATPRYGVLAAPKGHPFGTRMHLDGYGLGTVHDRGGRIVSHGDVDRVDVWMGHGEQGLHRARDWGIRDQIATVFVDGDAEDIDRLAGVVLDG